MSHQLTTIKTKPVPNGKMAKIMTHCQSWQDKKECDPRKIFIQLSGATLFTAGSWQRSYLTTFLPFMM